MDIVISVVLLFVGIGVLVLIHACIVGRTLRSGLSDNNVNMVERGSFGSTSMSQDDIEKLPSFDFQGKEEKGSSPAADCAVCLENFRVGEKCRLLPSCNHSFHAECVDLWLLRAPICPICRSCADSVKSGSLFGEESSCFRDGPETETGLGNGVDNWDSSGRVVEVGESQERRSGELTEMGIDAEGRGDELRDRITL